MMIALLSLSLSDRFNQNSEVILCSKTHHTDFTKTNSSNSVASNLVAGNNIDIATNKTYNQKGSNLLSQNGNIDIKAKTANISAGENSFISEYGSKTITAGVSVGKGSLI